MSDLISRTCEPCRVGAPLATAQEIEDWLLQLPQWEIREVDHIRQLTRTFTFKDFAQALAFTSKVGALAEQEGHHPEILTGWGAVTVTWWTHKIGGLHVNDFIMAAKTEALQ
jgi:4a-hydroxytetrahydrobiopterin dehydratase